MKYRIHTKKDIVIMKCRLAYNERVSERELDFLTKNKVKGLLDISFDGKKQLVYQAPDVVSLEKYLKGGQLQETVFWRIMTQMIDVAVTAKSRGLYPAHLLIQPDTVFIKEDTQEMFFVYLPVVSNKNMTDNLFAVIHDILYQEMKKGDGENHSYLIDFQNYLSQSDYSPEHVRQYIDMASSSTGNSRNAMYQAGHTMQEAEDLDQYTVLLGSSPSNVQEAGARITRLKGNEQKNLSGDMLYLGRSSQSDYCITGNTSIGRRHAVIKKYNSEWYIADLGSMNGTSVNGKQLVKEKAYRLQSGDRIRLADEEFIFEC